MKITCSLQQPQIEKLYAHLYGHLLDNQKKSKVFDAEAYMKNLFDKIASKTDPDNAAKFLQQIPSLLRRAAASASLEASELKTDYLIPINKNFKNEDTGLSYIVKYFNQTLDLNVQKELIEQNATEAFNVEEKDVEEVDEEELQDEPNSVFSTTFQERKPQPFKNPSILDVTEPSREYIYTTIRKIKAILDGTAILKNIKYQGVSLKLKPVRLSTADPEELSKISKRLQERQAYLKRTGQALTTVTTADKIFLMVITDEDGNNVYFNSEGDITTKEEGGKLVFQYLRDARIENGKYRVTDIYGIEDQMPSPEILVKREVKKQNLTLTDAEFKELVAEKEKAQQKDFKELYDFRQDLIKGEEVLLDITAITAGVPQFNEKFTLQTLGNINTKNINTLDVFKTIKTIKTSRDSFIDGSSVITIDGKEFGLDRPNLTDDLINKIAAVLVNKNLSREARYNFVLQFLAENASNKTRKHKLTYLKKTDTLLFQYSKNTAEEGYDKKFTTVDLNSETAVQEITNALKFASGTKEKYFSAKMTYDKVSLDRNGYQDYNLETGELSKDYLSYIELLKTLPNTEIFGANDKLFNSFIRFALPSTYGEQSAESQKETEEIEIDDFFDTLLTPSDKGVLSPKAKKDILVDGLKKGIEITGTISKAPGSKTGWEFNLPNGSVVTFYDHENRIVADDFTKTATLFLLGDKVINNKEYTDIVQVKIGDKVIGNVRETSDATFELLRESETKEESRTQEEIDAEIDDEINNIDRKQPSDDSPFFTRSGELSGEVTEEEVKKATEWWATSDLNKHIGFREAVNLVNSNAYARFMSYASILNGKLGVIEIAKKGSMVDVYHEAWHGFSQLYLTRKQKASLYKEVRRKLGRNKKLSFFEIEEIIAEEFREYAKNPKPKSDSPVRNTLFRIILNFLRELLGKGSVTNVRDIDNVKILFEKLYFNKDLNNYLPTIDNVSFVELFRNNGVIAPGSKTNQVLNRQDSNTLSQSMDTIISRIVDNESKRTGDKAGTLAIVLDSRNREGIYTRIKKDFEYSLEQYEAKLKALSPAIEEQGTRDRLENRIRILKIAIDNYGDSKNGLIAYHLKNSNFSLLKQKYTSFELDEDGNLVEIDTAETSERYGDKKVGDKALIQLAGKETIYILQSLFKITDGKVEYNELGYEKLVDFRKIWNDTVRAISGIQDPQEMYNKLLEESKTVPEFKQLIESKLPNPQINNNKPNEYNATTSFWQDFNKPRVHYYQFTIFENGDGTVTEASIEVRNVINQFKDRFKSDVTNTYVTRKNKDNIPTLDLKAIVDEFSDKNGALDVSKSWEFARSLGIYLDNLTIIKDTLKKNEDNISQFGLQYIFKIVKAIYQKDISENVSVTAREAIQEFKTDPIKVLMAGSKPGLLTKEGFKQKNKIEILAKLQGRYGYDSSNFGVLNAEKQLVFEHIDNNTASKIVYAINNAEKLSDLWTSDKFGYMSYLDPKINSFTYRSHIIKSLFDMRDPEMSRLTSRDLELFMDSGTQIEATKSGVNTTSLDVSSKRFQEINTMLTGGIQEFMRHAGKSSSFGAKINGGIIGAPGKEGIDSKLWVDVEMFAKKTAHSYAFEAHMLPYIQAETERIYRFKQNIDEFKKYKGYNRKLKSGRMAGEEYTAFDAVLSEDTKEKIYTAITASIKAKESFDLIAFLNKDNGALLGTVKKEVTGYFAGQTSKNLKAFAKANYLSPTIKEKITVFKLTSEQETELLVDAYTYNSWIQNFEMASLFYGDIVQYNHAKEELHKRNAGLTSGGRSIRTDIAAQNFSNGYLANTSYAATKNGFPTINYDGKLNTAIIQEVKRTSLYLEEIENALTKDYTKRFNKVLPKDQVAAAVKTRVDQEVSKYIDMEEGDGQGWITLDGYRLLKTNENNWSNAQEVLFQKIINGTEVSVADITEFFPAYKLQNFGHLSSTGLPVNAMHKFSLMPLIPSMIQNSDLQSLHEQMMKKNIQYVTFQSGSKVGSVTSEVNEKGEAVADEIYEKGTDNKTLKADIKFTPNVIYVEYLKNVTAVPTKFKNKTVFPTQLRKLILNGMYENGKIINEKKNGEAIRAYELAVDHHSAVLKLELLNEIGYTYDPKTKKYTGNINQFLNVVQDELEKRELPEHLIQMVGLNRDKSLKTDLSLHLKADEIEKILVSLVEKRLIKQKIKGEAFVQVASSMTNGIWDSQTRFRNATLADQKKYIGTNNLPFFSEESTDLDVKYKDYTKEKLAESLKINKGILVDQANYYTARNRYNLRVETDYLEAVLAGKKPKVKLVSNTSAMKIAIALQGDFLNLLKLKDTNGEPIGTRQRLNELIKDEEWLNKDDNRKAVTLTGVRIPVQGVNSMEFMEVYEFLDPSAGGIIIVPTEIVAKSGADFDIDKLTTFLPHIDKDGNFVKGGISTEALEAEVARLNKTKDGKKDVFNLIKSQKAASENNLITTIRGILELEDNFVSLIRPNDTYLLKEIADNLKEKFTGATSQGISPTNTLEVEYNMAKHDENMVAKKVLGIIALENALNPIFNSIGATMPLTYKESSYNKAGKLIEGDIDYDVRLLVPHNKTKDGKISLSSIYSADGMDEISELFSQSLNGALDAEKDAWIFFIQGNLELVPMLLFLFKAGVPRMEAIMMVSQPLVREYAEQQRFIKSAYAPVTGLIDKDYNIAFAKYTAANNVLSSRPSIEQNLEKIMPEANLLKLKDALNKQTPYGENIEISIIIGTKPGTDRNGKAIEVFDLEKVPTTKQKLLNDLSKGTIDIKQLYSVNYPKQGTLPATGVWIQIGEFAVSNANFYYTAKAATKGIKEFSLKELEDIVMTDDATSPKALAVFLHVLELEKSSKGFSTLKSLSNPDTKTSKTIQEIVRRNVSLEDAKDLSKLDYGLVEAMQDSILGSFFDNQLIKDLIIPLFQLRNNDRVTNYILQKIETHPNLITDRFGKGQDGVSQFITQFKNAIPNYIFQNYMSHFIDENGELTNMPSEFKNLKVKQKDKVIRGAQVVGDTIFVDEAKLKKDYADKVYLNTNTTTSAYNNTGLKGFDTEDNMFPNESSYVRYVFEREYQRNAFPIDSLKTNKDYLKIKSLLSNEGVPENQVSKLAYEEYTNQQALLNAYNGQAISGIENNSYTDMVMNIIQEFPQLKNKYPIVSQFSKPLTITKAFRQVYGETKIDIVQNFVLTLNDVKMLKDGQIAEIYYQNLLDLADSTIKKSSNTEDNARISKLFAQLPLMMIYQHGIGYSALGFNEALPYQDYVDVMQTASIIFEEKVLDVNTLNTIFNLLTNPLNKKIKNYVAPKATEFKKAPVVETPEVPVVNVEDLDPSVLALLKKNLVNKDTQSSTSVKPTTRKTYSGKVTKLAPNQIFVFGSNPEGRHGAGAAKYAKDNFGAMYGQGEGLQGQSYALPTKDLRVKENNSLKSISPEQIIISIKKLYDLANKGYKEFLVSDYSGTNLNGYTGQEMADMFIAAGPIPNNIVFHENFDKLITTQSSTSVEKNVTFETAAGSIYTMYPNGRVDRYKTATKEKQETNDLIVFVKFKSPEQEQDFLHGVQRRQTSGTKVYVIDEKGNKYSKGSDIKGKDVKLVLVETKTNKVIDMVETKQEPTIGYNTYDESRYVENGEAMRRMHIGNEVTKITTTQPTTQSSTSVKPGVQELFDSNPELANQVYEALGFKRKEYSTSKKRLQGSTELVDDVASLMKDKSFVDKYVGFRKYFNIVTDIETMIGTYGHYKEGLTQPESVLQELQNLIDSHIEGFNYNVTPQQKQQAFQAYSQYLDTVFPDSKVKDIVYHATKNKDKILEEGFDKNYLTSRTGMSNKFWDPVGELEKRNKLGFFFAKNGKSIVLSLQGFGERLSGSKLQNSVLPIILNLKNPQIIDDLDTSKVKEGYDGIISTEDFHIPDNAGGIDYTDTIYVAPEPEQIHILGSKQDIEEFKKFVSQSTTQSSTSVEDTLPSSIQKNVISSNKPDINIREKYFKDSEIVKASALLNAIGESNHPLNTLAKHLKSFANINDVDILLKEQVGFNVNPDFLSGGYYDPINNNISIAEFTNVKNGQSETLLLHEILHALSYSALRKDNEFNKDFQKLYNHSINELGKFNTKDLTGPYANYTIDEFFVALFTDAKFITQLKELAPADVKNYKNLFEEIIDAILNVLGLNKGSSAYNQAFAIASNILQEESEQQESIRSYNELTSYEDLSEAMFDREQFEAENNLNSPEGLPGIERTSLDCQ